MTQNITCGHDCLTSHEHGSNMDTSHGKVVLIVLEQLGPGWEGLFERERKR